MTQQTFDPKFVEANPYQTRAIDPAHVQELADDFKVRGMLQPPTLRERPDAPGYYQLAFGHHRFEAWKIAFPEQPFPANLAPLSDKQLAEYAIVENEQRHALSAIEKARTMKRFIDEFHATQLEAGALFGLKSQGAVSNLLRFLEAPAKVQELVGRGLVAEGPARELLTVAKLNTQRAEQIAESSTNIAEDKRSEWIAEKIEDALDDDKVTRDLSNAAWAMDWPKKPIVIVIDGHDVERGACNGCNFRHGKQSWNRRCLQPACFDQKMELCIANHLQTASKKLGIAIVKPDEKTTIVYDGKYQAGMDELVTAALKSKNALLRLVECKTTQNYYARENRLGTRWAALATTDMEALVKALKVKDPAEVKANEVEKQKRERERQKELRKQREAEEQESKRLIAIAAPLLSKWLPNDKFVLGLIGSSLDYTSESDARDLKLGDERATIMAAWLLFECDQSGDPMTDYIVKLAKALKAKLPAGWDKPKVEAERKPTKREAKKKKSK